MQRPTCQVLFDTGAGDGVSKQLPWLAATVGRLTVSGDVVTVYASFCATKWRMCSVEAMAFSAAVMLGVPRGAIPGMPSG